MRVLPVLLIVLYPATLLSSQWNSHEVDKDIKYVYYRPIMFPIRFSTVKNTDPRLDETWLTLYFDGYYWGQLRFSSRSWGVELYSCTDADLFDDKNVLTDVPVGPVWIWEISWDADTFYMECNGKRVWSFRFDDAIYSDSNCRGRYTGKRGDISRFKFNGDRRNVPKMYFTRNSTCES